MSAGDNAALIERDAQGGDLRSVLMPVVPTIVEAAIAAIRDGEPALGGAQAALERNLRRGLTDAVDRWFDGAPSDSANLDLHFSLGRAQARADRTLDELMAFYRIAAQTMWRRLAEIGYARGIEPAALFHLAETGFGCVEEISTQAAAGFADELTHRSGTYRTRRSELVRLLLKDPAPAPDVLLAAAGAGGLELTEEVAIYVGAAEAYEAFTRAAPEAPLLGPREGDFVGVLLDPGGPGRRRQLELCAQRSEVTLALGPAAPHAEAPASLARARALHALVRAGAVAAQPLIACEDHAVALLLSADAGLGGELCRRALAPLERVRGEHTRANLRETLRAWLAHPGQRKTIAHALGVHPQTVRYRVARLRELFGPQLEDPDGRFELELALRIEELGGAPAAPGGS